MKVKYSITIAITILLINSPAISQPIKIATWDIENLRDTNNEEPNRRNKTDYDHLADYAVQLDADITAPQEMERDELQSKLPHAF